MKTVLLYANILRAYASFPFYQHLTRSSLVPSLGASMCKTDLAGQSTLLLPRLPLDSFRCCQPLENPGLGELLMSSTPCAIYSRLWKAILSLLVFFFFISTFIFSFSPLSTPSASHPSGSSQCTSPEHPVSCIEPGLAIRFTYVMYMFQGHSPISSRPHPLPQSPKDCSVHLCLSCCLTYGVIITIFLNSGFQ